MLYIESYLIILLLKGVFFNMKNVHMDVPYKSMKLNKKHSSPTVFNKIIYKIMKIDFKNSPKIKFYFLETKIWYA